MLLPKHVEETELFTQQGELFVDLRRVAARHEYYVRVVVLHMHVHLGAQTTWAYQHRAESRHEERGDKLGTSQCNKNVSRFPPSHGFACFLHTPRTAAHVHTSPIIMTQAASDWTLSAHPTIPKGLPVCIAIIDGYGENEFKDEYNAVHSAQTPVFDKLRASTSRFRAVAAHGPAVGLPSSDDMGNSEVGHNALGAGKIYDQGAKLVDKNLETGQLFRDEGWAYIKSAFAENALHFIGLLSSGGVHSRYNQLIALVKQAAAASCPPALLPGVALVRCL